jgi:hypothetical protein
MSEFPICPLCSKPVNINTDAHVTEIVDSVEIVKHHECPVESVAEE